MSGGFFAVFDDISMLLDDAASMSKVATKKTVAILGDDLAVNAQKASGFSASRELPVLWAITKGSFKNKLIILPFAFLLSAFAPWLVTIILLFGGVYLAFEGMEKIVEYIFHKGNKIQHKTKTHYTKEEILDQEKEKIKSAIVTDFVLSIEIIIMALGIVLQESLIIQIIATTVVAFLATIGVYGVVALIIRMDDFGFKLIEISNSKSGVLNFLGKALVNALPKVIKILMVIGTFAMLLVAGGIFNHNVHEIHTIYESMPHLVADFLVGSIVGLCAIGLVKIYQKMRLS